MVSSLSRKLLQTNTPAASRLPSARVSIHQLSSRIPLLCYVFVTRRPIFFLSAWLPVCLLPIWLSGQQATQALPLSQIIPTLETRFEVRFGYDPQAIHGFRLPGTILKAGNLQMALDQISSALPLEVYRPDGQAVLLRPRVRSTVSEESTKDLTHIVGRIVDSWTGEPLPYADVLSGNLGFAADAKGNFAGWVDSREKMTFRSMGYSSKTQDFPAHREGPWTIALTPEVKPLPIVEVSARQPALLLKDDGSFLRLQTDFWKGVPAFVAGSDILRAMKYLPGVDATSDYAAGLSVRGANDEENLVIMDGIKLHQVSHFFGFFSVMNSDAVGQVNFYRNALPVSYGAQTSSVLELHSLSPKNQAGFSGNLSSNLLTAQGLISGQPAPGHQVLFSARTSHGNLGNSPLFSALRSQSVSPVFYRPEIKGDILREVAAYTPNYAFRDFQGKWTWQLGSRQDLRVAFFSGSDGMNYAFEKSSRFTRGKTTYLRRENFREETSWQNTGASLRWQFRPDDQWNHSLLLSSSVFRMDAALSNQFRILPEQAPPKTYLFHNAHQNEVAGSEITWASRFQPESGIAWTFGWQALRHNVSYQVVQDDIRPLEGQDSRWQTALFSEWDRSWETFSLQAGARLNHFGQNLYFTPVLSFSYGEPSSQWKLKGSAGRYFQFLRQLTHEDRYGRNHTYRVLSGTDFPVLRSWQTMLGTHARGKLWEFDLEGYSRHSQGVLEQALTVNQPLRPEDNLAPGPAPFVLFKGKGTTRGLDVFLRYNGIKGSGSMAYTLSQSTQQFREINGGKPFPSPLDRRHLLKMNGLLHLGRFDFSAAYVLGSGRPFTDLAKILGSQEAKGQNQPSGAGQSNNWRTRANPIDRLSYLESYRRLDVGGSINFALGRKTRLTLEASVFNLLNRQNVQYRQFVFQIPGTYLATMPEKEQVVGTEIQGLGITPNISIKLSY